MKFTKDPRWEPWGGTDDFESFNKNIVPEFYFKDEVPDDVKKSFKVVENLLIHSYYEYEFCDVAASKAWQIFEMALKIRYFELTEENWVKKTKKGEKRRNLKNLIDWFQDQNYFEVTNNEYLNHIRNFRNYQTHPNFHSTAGPFMLKWIEQPIDLINDLYENTSLREKRKNKLHWISDELNRIFKNGAVIEYMGKSYILYDCSVIFIDNKNTPDLYYVAFVPIFNFKNIYNKKYDPKRIDIIYLISNEIIFEKDRCKVKQINSNNIYSIKKISDSHELKDFNAWKNILKSDLNSFAHSSKLMSEIDQQFSVIRREFHKKD